MKKYIVFITDCNDIAYSELRATVLIELTKLNPNHSIEIEPVVSVKPFSIINGCFALRLMAESYPEGTIFSVILNPSKERPERLMGKTSSKNFLFIGANTGVFEWFLRDFGVEQLYELTDPGFKPFGGKYVHAPAVAQIASGVAFSKLGTPFFHDKLRKLLIPSGAIIHIDNFGLMKFNSSLPQLADGEIVSVQVNNRKISAIYTKRMMNQETGDWVIYPGSSLGLPELGKVRQNGAIEIGAKEGDIIMLPL